VGAAFAMDWPIISMRFNTPRFNCGEPWAVMSVVAIMIDFSWVVRSSDAV
jgi:hypothetical protein